MTDAFAGASGADLMRPAVPRFDPLFDQVANRARSREALRARRNADDVGCGLLRLTHRRDRLHGWGGRIRTSMCAEKIHLIEMSRQFGFRRPRGDGCGPDGE
jgi:hypothetical protein